MIWLWDHRSSLSTPQCETIKMSIFPTIEWFFSPASKPAMRYNVGNNEYTKYDLNLFQVKNLNILRSHTAHT